MATWLFLILGLSIAWCVMVYFQKLRGTKLETAKTARYDLEAIYISPIMGWLHDERYATGEPCMRCGGDDVPLTRSTLDRALWVCLWCAEKYSLDYYLSQGQAQWQQDMATVWYEPTLKSEYQRSSRNPLSALGVSIAELENESSGGDVADVLVKTMGSMSGVELKLLQERLQAQVANGVGTQMIVLEEPGLEYVAVLSGDSPKPVSYIRTRKEVLEENLAEDLEALVQKLNEREIR